MKYLNHTMLFLLLILLSLACQPKEEVAKLENTSETEESIHKVSTLTIEKSEVNKILEYSANLFPKKEIYYAPATPGRIEKIFVDLGSRVKKGQVLLEMDQTQLLTAKTQLRSAEDAYNRINKLHELGSISDQQYEQTKTQLELAQANVDFLKKNSSYTAPISGIITGKYFENGEMFSGAPNTQIGKAAVVIIQQINPLKAIVNISQKYYPMIKKGMAAEFTNEIYPDKVFQGKVSKIHPVVDPMTRTFKTEFLITNPNEILKPGMSSDMEIILGSTEGYLLPSIAVLKQSGTNNRYIYVHENGKAKRIDVEVIKRHNDKLEIRSDEELSGIELIVEGQSKLLNGSSIEIVKN